MQDTEGPHQHAQVGKMFETLKQQYNKKLKVSNCDFHM